MKLHTSLLAVAVAMAWTAAAHADLTYSFNTDAEGFQNVSWLPASPVGWAGGAAVQQTHTAGGWQMFMTKEFSWGTGGGSANQQLEMQALANQGANARLSFDVMADGGSFPTGGATWFQFWIVGNSDGAAGWTQVQLIDASQNQGQSDLRTWHIDTPFTQIGWQSGDTWFQLYTGANSDAAVPVNFYLDNVKCYVVPEPGMLALAGLGAAALLVFRRR